MPQGEFLDEYFNVNDHYNIGFPQISVSRYLTKNLNLTVSGSFNQITKWGELPGDESVQVDDLTYLGLDGMISYDFDNLLHKEKFVPYIGVGGGYMWIEEGAFNTFSSSNGRDNLVGAGTLNGTVGFKYWLTPGVGINVQSSYKHSFEDYLVDHLQHSVGIIVNFGEITDNKKLDDTDEDGVPNDYDLCPNTPGIAELGGCPDTDGDGVIDKDDLCPNKKGLPQFGGCPDTDGDGFADNKDECPNVVGYVNGCPAKVETEVDNNDDDNEVMTLSQSRKVYFEFDSDILDENAKEILNTLTENSSDYSYEIIVEGHADNIGNPDYNQNLSRRRAEAVKNYLTSNGVDTSSVSLAAEGESEPIASNNTSYGRALNRRAELTIKITKK